ncbi:hypothetical protein J6590_008746 [Homalodisca vitripennis]|nr:hypothetical protein J6590_008746 [Homalodisca vitripennis]
MSVQMVRRWRAMFLEGRENVHDDERNGRPANFRQPDVINAVQAVIDNDKRVTLDEIMDELPSGVEVSRSSVHNIMTEDLQLAKRWRRNIKSAGLQVNVYLYVAGTAVRDEPHP